MAWKAMGKRKATVCYLFIGDRSSDRARTAWRNEVSPIGIYSSGEFRGGESRSSLAITRSRCWKNARVMDGVASFDGLRSREKMATFAQKSAQKRQTVLLEKKWRNSDKMDFISPITKESRRLTRSLHKFFSRFISFFQSVSMYRSYRLFKRTKKEQKWNSREVPNWIANISFTKIEKRREKRDFRDFRATASQVENWEVQSFSANENGASIPPFSRSFVERQTTRREAAEDKVGINKIKHGRLCHELLGRRSCWKFPGEDALERGNFDRVATSVIKTETCNREFLWTNSEGCC